MQKKLICGMICVVFVLAGVSSVGSSVIGSSFDEGSLVVTFAAGSYGTMVDDDGCMVLEMDGFGSWIAPGEVIVPVKTMFVGLPPGAEAYAIEIVSSSVEELPAELVFSLAGPVGNGEGDVISGSTDLSCSPEKCCWLMGMSHLRKYAMARVQFFPVTFDADGEGFVLHSSVEVRVLYRIVEEVSDVAFVDTAMDAEAAELIINFDAIKELYVTDVVPENRQSYDYFIITTSGTSSAINAFITWKTSIGLTVGSTTVGWIMTHHPSGDTQKSIRDYLKNNYQAWGTKYVLLVGTHASIPMRTCWPDPNVHTADGQHDIPTDYYYADLSGSWDSDGDGFYGEMGHDSVDFVPEVYVGRIPSDSSSTVSAIALKIQNFEQTAYTGWKRNAMLLGAVYGYANEDFTGNPRWDGAEVMEQIRTNVLTGFSITNMYETAGLAPCTHSCTSGLTNTNVVTAWGATTGYGILNWASHGLSTQANRWLWGWDDGDGVPETGNGEVTWPIFLQSSDATSLYNSKPPIVFAASCYCAHPETTNNLGAAVLTQGAAAFIGATRVSWGSIGWTQPSHGGHGTVCYDFNDRIANNGEECGQAMYSAKQYVFNNYPWGGWWDYANMYDFVLYGDASMSMNLAPSIPSQPTGPLNGQVGMPLTYSTSTADPSGDFIKYGWDWNGDMVVDQWDDNNGYYYPPHQPISTTHVWNSPGTYQVQVKAEDVYGKQSGFSQPITVVIIGNSPPAQPQTPQGPANGKAGVSYPYTTMATDPEGDPVKYGWDWDGDMIVDQWDDNGGAYYPPGAVITTQHSWSQKGTYTIYVMAEDINGGPSVWSNPLTVSMPRNHMLLNQFPILKWFFSTFFPTFF